MCRFATLLLALSFLAVADPPYAFVSQQITVPASMQTDVFSTPQYVMVPPGFQISVWARLAGARFLAVAPNGDVFVSQPASGQVTILRQNPNGNPTQYVYVSGLNMPQGLAFDTINGVTYLYVGETGQVDSYVYNNGDTTAPAGKVLIPNLPAGADHPYKDIAVGPDHSIYVGIGSDCNVCVESSTGYLRGTVYQFNSDGSGGTLYSQGLRNAEGLAFVPGTNTLWAAANHRDQVLYPYMDSTGDFDQLVTSYVDNNPPDMFTQLAPSANFGWPYCDPAQPGYGPQFVIDLDTNENGQVNCSTMTPVSLGLQAHSAPLGMIFLQGTSFAPPYSPAAVVAFHGSWDRSVPTGYKVVFLPWGGTGPYQQYDLVSGFYGFGRPVDVAVASDSSLLITDDSSGTVYKLVWNPSAVSAATGYPIITPGSYASAYGTAFPAQTAAATLPYPTTLGGVSLTITDASGNSSQASLVYVSPTLINFVVPAGVASGNAQLTLKTGSSSINLGSALVNSVEMGLFTISQDGKGPALTSAVDSNGNQIQTISCSSGTCTQVPINLTNGPVYLSLYGTGFRNAPSGSVYAVINGDYVPLLYAGAQPTYPGLDQVNLQIPAHLAGKGGFSLQLGMNNGAESSNPVTIAVQ